MLGSRAVPGLRRLPCGLLPLCAAAVLLPVPATAARPTAAGLRAANAAIERQRRSAVLDLYSLDARLGAAQGRLAALRAQASALRAERARLERELRLARADVRVSQLRLAARLRALYERSGSGTLEVLLGASSLSDVLSQLDTIDRVDSLDTQIVSDLRAAGARALRARRALAAREARLAESIRQARAEAARLAAVHAERAAFVAALAAREAANARAIVRVEAAARAAAARTQALTGARLRAAVAAPVPAGTRGGVVVVSTGYCLSGRTATGIAAGWGVAAVDPRVIPLGTHLTIPGYGEAVAADTGSAIVGDRIDLWFPSCAQAGAWGSRSVTIALH